MLRQHFEAAGAQGFTVELVCHHGVARGFAFENFEAVAGDHKGAGRFVETVVGAADALDEARSTFWGADTDDAIDLARDFSNTTIILNHVGGVLGVGPYRGRRQEILAGWKKDIAELAKSPNVHIKLGGVGMTSFGFDFSERDMPPSSEELAAAWRQYIEPCIEAFSVDRCMFESNFPPDKQSGGYTELWNAFKRITSGVSAVDKKALYSGTAARVYRLTAP